MDQITEPLSKYGLFKRMRAELIAMAAADADLMKRGDDSLEAAQRYCDAEDALLELWREAEDNGLMRELAGYLSTTYGG